MINMKFLQIEVNKQNYLIDTDSILELLPYRNPTPTTYNSQLLDGIISHKDKIIPLVSMRKLLGFPVFKTEQLSFLTKVEAQHVAWVKEFENTLQTGEKFTKALDPHQCELGKWIDQTVACLRCNNDGFVDILTKQVIPYHTALHENGANFLEDTSTEQESKIRIINKCAHDTLSGLTILKQEIERLTSAFEQIVLMEIDGKEVDVVVDRIDKTHDLDEKNYLISTKNLSRDSKYIQFIDHYDINKSLMFSMKFTSEFIKLIK
jgi:chemotaxis signal transduction protein